MKHTLKRFAALLLALVLLTGLLPTVLAEGTELTNVALGAAVTATSNFDGAGLYYPSFLTDGKLGDYPAEQQLGWCVVEPASATITLGQSCKLSKIEICPVAFETGKFFPSAYTVSVSADGETWIEVADETDVPAPGSDAQVISFEEITAKYIKLDMTPRSVTEDDSSISVYAQVSELRAYGVPTGEQEPEPEEPEAQPEGTNIALHKPVTASNSHYESTYWHASFLTDGENHDLSGGNNVGWSSTDPVAVDQEIDLTVDLQGTFQIDAISLLPTAFDNGKFFPVAYTLQVSQDGTTWTDVASDRKDTAPAVEPQNYFMDAETETVASYVRIHITENRTVGANTLSQLGEIEVYGTRLPSGNNIALHKPVTDTNGSNDGTYWHTSFLTDGENHGLDGGNNVGWSSTDPVAVDQEIDLTVDLQGTFLLDSISLLPTVFDSGKFFPVAYTLQVSRDGKTWTDVASDRKDEVPAVEPQTYFMDAETVASYVRVHITENRSNGTNTLSQLGEIEVYGFEANSDDPAYTGTNVALGQKVSADNYFEDPDSNRNYAVEELVDGLRGKSSEGTRYGYATKKNVEETTPVSFQVELDGIYAVDNVTLVPVQMDSGAFFPQDYEIFTSVDGINWTSLEKVVGAETGAVLRQHKPAEAVNARYVKVEITRHRYATGTYRGQLETLWGSRIAEIEIYGEVVTRDAPYINKSALQMNAGSKDQLSVGWRVGDPLNNVTWVSNNPNVVTISETGAVQAVANGTAVITGYYPAGDTYPEGSVTCSVTISDYKATDNLMITTFWPMLKENMTQEYVNDIANAGFNNIQLQYSLDVANYDDNMTIIGMAQKAGIGVTVNEKDWGWGFITNWSDEEITAAAQKYSHIPGVIGYFLVDEPMSSVQASFYHCFKAFRDAMPEADVHMNFLPDLAGMKELMQSEAAPYVEYLMWDAYIYPNVGVRDNALFTCSNNVRLLGLKYGVKTAQYIQSCGFNGAFRRPNGDEIRYNVNAALAYGNKQIAYFTYRKPADVGEVFTDAIVKEDGTKTDLYEDVAGINNAALQLGPTLMSVEALEVYHTGEESGVNNPLPENFFLQPTSSSGRGLIISYMKNLDTNQNYVMLVNRDYVNAATVSFTVDEAAGALQYVSQEDGNLKALTGNSVELVPGGCILIKTADDFDFVPGYGEFDETPAGQNAAAGDLVTVSAPGANVTQLTDGARIVHDFDPNISVSCDLLGYQATVGDGTAITLDFGGLQTLNRVDLYPGAADQFPSSFVLEGSADGNTWTELANETAYVLPENLACSLTFATAQYQYLRLTVRATASGSLQLCELEAYNDDGTVPALRPLNGAVEVDKDQKPADNLARGELVTVISSDNHPQGDTYWRPELINDGYGYDALLLTGITAGWSSRPGRERATDAAWIGYDLGEVKNITKVVAFNAWHERPNEGKAAECYPADYKIQVSMDGETWTNVYEVYNDTNWTQVGARTFEFDGVNARYVRFYGERLGRSEGFLMQLSELEVYGGNAVEEPADKTALNAAIAAAEALNENDYTDESWADLQAALAAARSAAGAEDVSQDDVDAATAAVTEAMEALKRKPAAETADKTALNAAIAAAEALNENDYTDESWADLQAALAAARSAAGAEDVSQDDVDAATAALAEAMIALEKKPVVKPGDRPVIGTPSKPVDKFTGTFTDVAPEDWYFDAVKYVYVNGLFKGVTATTFQPNANMTRGMLVTVLYRLAGEPAVVGTSEFKDVSSDAYYDQAVRWAKVNGIVTGVTEETFQPDGNITREQMAAILYRYAKYAGMDVSARADLSSYADAGQISDYAKEAMSWAVAMGLISGRSATTLAPTGCATRAEVATILMRYDEYLS